MKFQLPEKVTGKTFEQPIMDAMASLHAQGKDKLRKKQIRARVLKMTGLDVMDAGVNRKGRPIIEAAINAATSSLFRKNLIYQPVEGKRLWALVIESEPEEEEDFLLEEDFEEEDEAPQSPASGLPEITPNLSLPEKPEKPSPKPEPETFDLGEGVRLPMPPSVTLDIEGVLLDLKIADAKCFGFYSPRSAQCKKCSLAGLCYEKMLDLLSEMSASLPSEETPETQKRPLRGEEITLHGEGLCASCGKVIPAKTKARWVKGEGLYHNECA